MPEISVVAQTVQIGVEAVPGTVVPANRKLQSLGFALDPEATINTFRPTGNKFPALAALGQDWTGGELTGLPTYDEIIYPLASLITNPSPTQIMDGATPTGGYRYVFTPASSTEDNPRTLTIERGSATLAQRAAYGLVTELGLTFARNGNEIGGALLARSMESGITLTASPTTLPLVPILPTQIDIFLDPTSAALGTTKLLRVLSVEFTLGDRYAPVWPLNSALPSFAAHVEQENSSEVVITMAADATAWALMGNMRAGDTRFMRLRATGPRIYTGATNVDYLFQLDMALKVTDAPNMGDEEGLETMEWTLGLMHDGAWGKAMVAEVICKQAAL